MGVDHTTGLTGVALLRPVPSQGEEGYAEGNTVALTYRELAGRLGVAVEAAKARARRGGWTRLPGNDGLVRVQVPTEALRMPRAAPEVLPQPNPTSEVEPSLTVLHAALDAQAEAHQGELARLGEAHAVVLAELREYRDRERSRADRIEATAVAERAAAGEDRRRLEVRVEALTTELAALRAQPAPATAPPLRGLLARLLRR